MYCQCDHCEDQADFHFDDRCEFCFAVCSDLPDGLFGTERQYSAVFVSMMRWKTHGVREKAILRGIDPILLVKAEVHRHAPSIQRLRLLEEGRRMDEVFAAIAKEAFL